MSYICEPTPFLAWPGFPYVASSDAFELQLKALIRQAVAGPCQKSRRGALLCAENLGVGLIEIQVNAPAGGAACDGSQLCRSSCARICNHAEELVVLAAMKRVGTLRNAHVLHVAIGEDGQPRRDKIQPSCDTCSRLMLAAGVQVVWLWGVTGCHSEWTPWPIADFHAATLRNCGLHNLARQAAVP